MKPSEIAKIKYCSAFTEKAIKGYLNEDCIIAYHQNEMSYCFIIKTKKSHFVFHGTERYFVGDTYNDFFRMSEYSVDDFIKDFENKLTILDEKEFMKFKAKRIIRELKNGN